MHPAGVRWKWAVAAGLLACTACSAEAAPPATASSAEPLAGGAGSAPGRSCGPTLGPAGDIAVPTVKGNLWALPMGQLPAATGRELKIVWRATGTGALTLRAELAGQPEVDPSWGPEYHTSSNFDRPGEEWGSGFVLPAAGCWKITAMRAGMQGTLRIQVAD